MNKPDFFLFLILLFFFPKESSAMADTVFRAGAATSNITPRIGTTINGSMQNIVIQHIHDDTHARALVLDNGETQLGFVVIGLYMVSWEAVDGG